MKYKNAAPPNNPMYEKCASATEAIAGPTVRDSAKHIRNVLMYSGASEGGMCERSTSSRAYANNCENATEASPSKMHPIRNNTQISRTMA